MSETLDETLDITCPNCLEYIRRHETSNVTETKRCSHILIISEKFDITDLGEYGQQHLHPIAGYPKDGLLIDSRIPEKKRYFVSTSDNVGIMDIISCSNANTDCIIFGSLAGEPIPQSTGGLLYRIRPYSHDTTEELIKEQNVKRLLEMHGARYIDKLLEVVSGQQPKTEPSLEPRRPNPIIERIKQVQL